MKRTIEVALVVVALVALAYALYTYDMDKDPTFHAHTATCAQEGCSYID